MKKWLSLMLAIVMVFLLVACNSNPSSDGGKPEESSKPDGDKEKVEISRGTIDGDVYKNEYLGFQFTKPQSWVYSTDDEIAAMVELSADKILGESFKNAAENNPSVFDMMVVDSLTGTNINLGYENLSKTFSSNITVSQYVEALKAQLAGVSGMTVTFPDTFGTAKLGNTEFTKVVCTAKAQGITMKQVYYLKKVDKFMSFVIVTIPSGYTVEQVEAMFK